MDPACRFTTLHYRLGPCAAGRQPRRCDAGLADPITLFLATAVSPTTAKGPAVTLRADWTASSALRLNLPCQLEGHENHDELKSHIFSADQDADITQAPKFSLVGTAQKTRSARMASNDSITLPRQDPVAQERRDRVAACTTSCPCRGVIFVLFYS